MRVFVRGFIGGTVMMSVLMACRAVGFKRQRAVLQRTEDESDPVLTHREHEAGSNHRARGQHQCRHGTRYTERSWAWSHWNTTGKGYDGRIIAGPRGGGQTAER